MFLAFLLENFDEGILKQKIVEQEIRDKKEKELLTKQLIGDKINPSSTMAVSKCDRLFNYLRAKAEGLKEFVKMLDDFEREKR